MNTELRDYSWLPAPEIDEMIPAEADISCDGYALLPAITKGHQDQATAISTRCITSPKNECGSKRRHPVHRVRGWDEGPDGDQGFKRLKVEALI